MIFDKSDLYLSIMSFPHGFWHFAWAIFCENIRHGLNGVALPGQAAVLFLGSLLCGLCFGPLDPQLTKSVPHHLVDEDPVWLDVCTTKTWINWMDNGWSWIWNTNASVSLGGTKKNCTEELEFALKDLPARALLCGSEGMMYPERGKIMGRAILCKGNFCQPIPPKLYHKKFVESLHLFRWEWWYIYPRYRIVKGFLVDSSSCLWKIQSQVLLAIDALRLGQLSSVFASLAEMLARDLDLTLGVEKGIDTWDDRRYMNHTHRYFYINHEKSLDIKISNQPCDIESHR